jgi:hypothetical protein
MPHKITIEVYIAVNEDADFETGCSADEATERLSENFGGQMVRIIRKAFRITPPDIADLGEEDVADEEGDVTRVEAEAAE